VTRWARRLSGGTELVLGLTGIARSSGSASGQTSQPDAVIVGDSLTGSNATYIRSALAENGLPDVQVEGMSGRRIAVSVELRGSRDSGIERIRSLMTGLRTSTELYVRDITALLGDLPGPRAPRAGTQTTARIGSPLD
jgi:hypothetical protein